MKAAEKGNSNLKASHTRRRVNTLHSYFVKTTQGRPTKEPNQVQHHQQHLEQHSSQNEVTLSKQLSDSVSAAAPNAAPGLSANRIQYEAVARSTPPPASAVLIPPTLGPPDGPKVQGSLSTHNSSGTTQLKQPDTHALMLLKSITYAARELPSLVPEAEEHNNIALVAWAGAPEETSEAWEHLDHMLNRLLGYGVDIEDIAQCVHCGPLGVHLQGDLTYSTAPTTASSSRVFPSANTGDDDSDIEYIGSIPLSPAIGSAP